MTTLADFVKRHEWHSFKLTVPVPHPDGPRPWEVDFVVFSFGKVKKRAEDGDNIFTYFIGGAGEALAQVEAGAWVPFAAGGMSTTALKYDNGFREDGNLGLIAFDTETKGLVYLPCQGRAQPRPLTASVETLFHGKPAAKARPARKTAAPRRRARKA